MSRDGSRESHVLWSGLNAAILSGGGRQGSNGVNLPDADPRSQGPPDQPASRSPLPQPS